MQPISIDYAVSGLREREADVRALLREREAARVSAEECGRPVSKVSVARRMPRLVPRFAFGRA